MSERILMGFMLAMAAVVVWGRTLTVSLLGLSMFSMFLTAMYQLRHAPDVAMTEAALGVGLTTLVFLIAIRRTGEGGDD